MAGSFVADVLLGETNEVSVPTCMAPGWHCIIACGCTQHLQCPATPFMFEVKHVEVCEG
jgi:hypothetical protein